MAELPVNSAVVITQKITAVLSSFVEKLIDGLAESWQVWLRTPVVKQIFEKIIQFVGEKFSTELQKDEALLIINCQSAEKKQACTDAITTLLAKPVGGLSDEEIKKIRDAFSNGINWPGVS